MSYVAAKRASRPEEAQNEEMDSKPPIDFFKSLQKGLEAIARSEPNSGSTEHLRLPEEHPAPVRTEPVSEVTLSLAEFLEQSERLRKDL